MRSTVSKLVLAFAFLVPAVALSADPAPAPTPKQPVKSSVNVPGTIVGPAKKLLTVKVNNPDKLDLTVVCQAPETKFEWFREFSEDPTVAVYKVYATVAGEYYLTVLISDNNKAVVVGTVKVVAGTPAPDPSPTPTPDPTPTPADEVPIPNVTGLHVLVLYESGDASTLPAAQQAVLYGKTVRDYLNLKSPLGPDGKTHQWRMWDKDVDASNEQPLWQDALKRGLDKVKNWIQPKDKDGKPVGPTKAVPWIIVSNGKAGYEGPLPANVADMMTLLKKYGE